MLKEKSKDFKNLTFSSPKTSGDIKECPACKISIGTFNGVDSCDSEIVAKLETEMRYSPEQPYVGDLSVCAACGEVLVYRSPKELGIPTDSEIKWFIQTYGEKSYTTVKILASGIKNQVVTKEELSKILYDK